MVPKALRTTALAAALAASSLPALPLSAQAAPWGWHGGWGGGWGGWGWGLGGFGVGLAAGLIGSALATPYYGYGYGYPAYPYYPAYTSYPNYGYYPGYASYPGYSYYPNYGYGYARTAYWGSGVYLRMTKGPAAGKHVTHRR